MWVLVFIMVNYYFQPVGSIEFTTQENCEKVAESIRGLTLNFQGHHPVAQCFKK